MVASTKRFTLTGSSYVDISEGATKIRTIVPFRRQSSNGVRFHIGQSLPSADTVNYEFVDPNNQPLAEGNQSRAVPVEFDSLGAGDRVYARVNTSTNEVTIDVHRFTEASGVSSGLYTPTATLVTNMDAVTPSGFHYYAVGDLVQVWGTLVLNATSAAAAQFDLTLPISSAFGSSASANGHLTANDEAGRVAANTSANRFSCFYTPLTTGDKTFCFSASYRIQ